MTEFDPRDPAQMADPFPIFRILREEAPVHRSAILGGWLLTRYEDVRLVISDRRFSADRIRPFFTKLPPAQQEEYGELSRSISAWAVFHDPPDHTRLRGLMNKAFTNRAVEGLEPTIRRIVDQLLDRVVDRGGMDLIADFAYPLPATVILAMLGLPTEDLDQVKIWSDDLALFVGSSVSTPDKYRRAADSIAHLNTYFRKAIEAQRRSPSPGLLADLLAAQDRGQVLSEEELVATCVLLLFAGHETTTNLIGNGMLGLIRHPKELARLRANPALLPSAVEEMLRYDGPAASAVRIATEAVPLHDAVIQPGDRVFAMLNAANRDPRVFADPEHLDVGRKENRHLAFGHGIHFCLGAPLARLEARIAFERLLARLADLELEDAPLEWSDSLVLRGVRQIPLRFRGTP